MIDNCQKWDLLDLTPEKYDICISIVVVNGVDTGQKSAISSSFLSIDSSQQTIPQSDITV